MQAIDRPSVLLVKSLLNPIVIVLCFILTTHFYGLKIEKQYFLLLVITFLIASLIFDEIDLQPDFKSSLLRSFGSIFARWTFLFGFLAILGYAAKMSHEFPRKLLFTWFLATPLVLVTVQVLAQYLLRSAVSKKGAQRRAIIVGVNELGLKLAKQFESVPYLGIDFVGFFDDRSPQRLGISGLNLLGKMSAVADFVRTQSIHLIYIALPMMAQPRIVDLLDRLRDTTASIYFVPDIFVFDLIQARFGNINGIPVVAVCESPFHGINRVTKRIVDIVLSSLILILISPLMLAIAIGVKLSSPGPVIFKQRRYGLDGEEIKVYKFRTMTVCEDGNNIRQASKDDNRITRFGRFLRRTSLDELPQFINVLQGRMSIVGPRPHAVAHNELYRTQIKGYMIRHKVKPGITGWAQVNGFRGETDTLQKMKSRIELDLDYLRNWSLSLDLWIILRTAGVFLKQDTAY
ncbi:undecaprenyl-phosphate glucose phosphotransferase [Methylocaldum szegediense]|uniref:UDP-glucose:undecaprenyl-phosphate glucose-1-phosphate transferase n=1 Tax=Methylocaldum szegediense TaxID=73780 RepID=A0ABM9HW37_9GAMM|nr:undecaprenyl-phosphate glucose phosphotransferase [Methylocaldum szegediense]CAI8725120.1 UDP-glucose:undecaprenyl-phosphate glucose-1-phosphate transferase [Methylocaldum szegediense]